MIENLFPNKDQADAQIAVLNRIADKMGAYQSPRSWGAFCAMLGLGIAPPAGAQLNVDTAETVTAAVVGTGITAATVDKDAFLEAAGTQAHDYEFIFDGHAWHYNGQPVTLSEYGIAVTGTAASGDTIEIHRSATVQPFDVMGLDQDVPVDTSIKHVLSVMAHAVLDYGTISFDPAQYLWPVTRESLDAIGISGDVLPADTVVKLTIDHGSYNGGTTQDGEIYGLVPADIPIGGGIRHNILGVYRNDSDYSMAKLLSGSFIFYGADRVTELGRSETYQASGGTSKNLGTATASDPQYKVGDFINFTQRQAYGSNRYYTSFAYQYLNSADAVMSFTPATIWSRPPTNLPEGFLHRLDPELRKHLCKVRKRYALPIADGSGYEDVEALVHLPSQLDVFGSTNNGIAEGAVDAAGNLKRDAAYPYWQERSTNADRIKYQGATARSWWLGSVLPSNANLVRYVSTSGALSNNSASNAYGLVPSLFIKSEI